MLNISLLAEFIRFQSIDNNQIGNQQSITFLTNILKILKFSVKVKGYEKSDQPVLIAHHPGNQSKQKLVLYGHYDVAPILENESWIINDPFKLTVSDGRIYGRGIADNKGPLFARIMAIKNLVENDLPFPEILWLIQGEEEIGKANRIAQQIFNNELRKFSCNVVVDETGFNDLDHTQAIGFVWSKKENHPLLTHYQKMILETINNSRIEFRHLNKFNGLQYCPLISNMSNDCIYLGFGPNDKLHNIHRGNESLDIAKLRMHVSNFKQFLITYALNSSNINY
jgi:acetylornithine deacetylase/succinyl-diaminopimelate desuccinylase-like protein